MTDDDGTMILKSATNNITHCNNQEDYAGRTQEAKFIHRACLEPLFYCRFASVQAEVFAVGSSFFVCSLQDMRSIVKVALCVDRSDSITAFQLIMT